MKFREIYDETVDAGKCLLKLAVGGAAVIGIVYGAEWAGLYRPGGRKANPAAALAIMIGSQNRDSKGGVIEIREVKYGESRLEKQVLVEEKRR